MRRGILGVALLLALLTPAAARADSYIQANCQVLLTGNQCVFTNSGADAGSACAVIHVAHRTSGRSTDSTMLCSGVLQPGASVTLPAAFAGAAPTAVCLTGAPPSWNDCTLNVTMSNATAVGKASGLGGFVWLVVFLTSLGVYFDAKRIGARKGLVQGLGDLAPGGWFVCCLLLWIFAFPLYLAKRGAIKAAAMASMSGAYGQGYGPPPQGYGPPPNQGGQPWQG